MNTQYNWLQNNTAQLYFILGRAELHWNFSSIPKDGSDIHISNSTHAWGPLPISEPSLGILEKFQHYWSSCRVCKIKNRFYIK